MGDPYPIRNVRPWRTPPKQSAPGDCAPPSNGSDRAAPHIERISTTREALHHRLLQNPIFGVTHGVSYACGFKLANDGQDTRAIQSFLGHKNIQHTVRYTELAPNQFKNFWRD